MLLKANQSDFISTSLAAEVARNLDRRPQDNTLLFEPEPSRYNLAAMKRFSA